MKLLFLEPFYGGSHRAFLDGWKANTSHDLRLMTLPPRKWKWRMRHAAVNFADDLEGEADVLLCSDMLNLAEFLGLTGDRFPKKVVYFHENQLTYPVRHEQERDYQYVFTNISTALAADQVWFNSAFNRDSFLEAIGPFLKRMPDQHPKGVVERIRKKSSVHPPAIDPMPARGERKPGPVRILWAHRWEHDKNPEAFFSAIADLEKEGVDFQISVLGEQFPEVPPVFEEAKEQFNKRILRWGYQESREEYVKALLEADVAVSTADHEFFGLGMVEAAAAGAFPCVPKRLAYPEVLKIDENPDFFYDDLTAKLIELAGQKLDASRGPKVIEPYLWRNAAPRMDAALK